MLDPNGLSEELGLSRVTQVHAGDPEAPWKVYAELQCQLTTLAKAEAWVHSGLLRQRVYSLPQHPQYRRLHRLHHLLQRLWQALAQAERLLVATCKRGTILLHVDAHVCITLCSLGSKLFLPFSPFSLVLSVKDPR